LLVGAALAALTLAAATGASAAITTYSGQDNGSSTAGPAPNSTAAQTAFFAGAGGPLSTETFEGQALGDPGTLSIAGGANVTWTAPNFGDGFSGVSTTTFGNVYGYDVTNSGRGKWLGFPGGSATFTFGSGVNAFGMWSAITIAPSSAPSSASSEKRCRLPSGISLVCSQLNHRC